MATAPHESSAVTLVTQTRVSPSHDEEFARWQEQVNNALAHFPGYLDQTVLPPNPPVQVDWVVVQRFASAKTARAWLQSEQRQRLLNTIQPLLVGQDDVHLFADDSGLKLPAPVSAIISMRVPPGQEVASRSGNAGSLWLKPRLRASVAIGSSHQSLGCRTTGRP